jgi:hypothetical protein
MLDTATAADPDFDSQRLAALREDLTWFFNAAPGEMGLRSSYPAMIRRLLTPGERGPAATGYELDELALDAARRARRIGRVLELAGADLAEVLRACFTLPVPRKLRPFGCGAALVPHLRVTMEVYRRHRDDEHPLELEQWLLRLPRVAARIPVLGRAQAEIVAAANQAYWNAVRAYAEARRRTATWR